MVDVRKRFPIEITDQERISNLLNAALLKQKFESDKDFYKRSGVSRQTYQNMMKGKKSLVNAIHLRAVLTALEVSPHDPLYRYLPDYNPSKAAHEQPGHSVNKEADIGQPATVVAVEPVPRRLFWRKPKLVSAIGASLAIIVVTMSLFLSSEEDPENVTLSDLQERGIAATVSSANIPEMTAIHRRIPAYSFERIFFQNIEDFFASAKGNQEATEWFVSTWLDRGLDPNILVPHGNDTKAAILFKAISAGNVDISIALLEAGAYPHPAVGLGILQNPVGRVASLNMDEDGELRLITALLDHGAIFVRPIIIDEEDRKHYYYTSSPDHYNVDWMDRIIARLDSDIDPRLGVSRTDHRFGLGQTRDERVCERVPATDTRDWCTFIQDFPAAFQNHGFNSSGTPHWRNRPERAYLIV